MKIQELWRKISALEKVFHDVSILVLEKWEHMIEFKFLCGLSWCSKYIQDLEDWWIYDIGGCSSCLFIRAGNTSMPYLRKMDRSEWYVLWDLLQVLNFVKHWFNFILSYYSFLIHYSFIPLFSPEIFEAKLT